MLFACLYCSLLYRNKKVKSLNDGFIERKKSKIVLYNEDMVEIDYCFDSRKLEFDRDFDFNSHYVSCQDPIDAPSNDFQVTSNMAPNIESIDRNSESGQAKTRTRPEISNHLRTSLFKKPKHDVSVMKARSGFNLNDSPQSLCPKLPLKAVNASNTQINSSDKLKTPSKFTVPTMSTKPIRSLQNTNMPPPKKSKTKAGNEFGFIFEELDHNWRLETINDSFKDTTEYQTQLKASISEIVNLNLSDMMKKYKKQLKRNTSQSLEAEMRKSQISFYENSKLEKYRLNEWSLDFDDEHRQNNVILQMVNKEKSSIYSKFDLWIVSKQKDFNKNYYFYSYNYGPNKNAVELVPISKDWDFEALDADDVDWFAIRALNCSTEITLMEMLQDLSETILGPYLINNNAKTVETKLIWKNTGYEYLKQMLNVISGEYTLNTQQNK